MALGLTQPLTEMSTRNISWGGGGGKAAGVLGWPPYHLHVSIVLKSESLSLLEPPGPVQACNGIALPVYILPSFTMTYSVINKQSLIFILMQIFRVTRKIRLS
jgi:hypothetical protein